MTRERPSPMLIGVNDDVSRSLPVEYHNSLMMGNGLPSPTWNSDFLGFERRHGFTVSNRYGSVQIRTDSIAA